MKSRVEFSIQSRKLCGTLHALETRPMFAMTVWVKFLLLPVSIFLDPDKYIHASTFMPAYSNAGAFVGGQLEARKEDIIAL